MRIETALVTYLLSKTAITQHIGDRLATGFAAQSTAQPYVVMTKISDIPEHVQSGRIGVRKVNYEFEIWAAQYNIASAIAIELLAALDGYQGIMGGTGGVYVHACFFDDERDESYMEGQTVKHGIVQGYYVTYRG